jgi:hypothetical protein
MPVIRATGRGEPLANLRTQLSEALVKELMGETTPKGPLIFEIPTARSDEIDVVVVWEAWRSLSPGERTDIIRNAYKQYGLELSDAIQSLDSTNAPRGPIGPRVAKIAIGTTWDQALAEGLLPYSVQPQVGSSDRIDLGSLRYLMIEAGAVERPEGLQLRFPDARLAADAQARLCEQMPAAHWAIVEEVGSVESWQGQ